MTHIRLDVPTCFDVETGLLRVIFRNPKTEKIGTGTRISKMESEPSIEDLIDQQRSFFLLNAKQLHGLARNWESARTQIFEAVEGRDKHI
jgi:hypothetical protein